MSLCNVYSHMSRHYTNHNTLCQDITIRVMSRRECVECGLRNICVVVCVERVVFVWFA